MLELKSARQGVLSERLRKVSETEGIEPAELCEAVAAGRTVILGSRKRTGIQPVGIGAGMRIKVNANIGTSADVRDTALELDKLEAAEHAGADTVMDLSSAGDMRAIRQAILAAASVPTGTVPVYEAARRRGSVQAMTPADLLDTIRAHIADGADFLTIHCGVTLEALRTLANTGRICGIVSRGGTILAEWMLNNNRENPLYEHFDEILSMAAEYDVVLSLGDGLRPGALADAGDAAQLEELITLGRLARKAREAGVQAMIEGPGHMPIDEIETQVRLAKTLCDGAPFYVLGPLVTDVAAGYDHISAAIGGAVAGMAGADYLCYVTASEHLALPGVREVAEGVYAARIAAHAADIARYKRRFRKWDDKVSRLRSQQDWPRMLEQLLDSERAAEIRAAAPPADSGTCSMCSDLCVFRLHKARASLGGSQSSPAEGREEGAEVPALRRRDDRGARRTGKPGGDKGKRP